MAAFVKNQALTRKLNVLGLHSVEDLLHYFPYRYDDFSRVLATRDLRAGEVVAVEGYVKDVKIIRAWNRGTQLLEAVVDDASGSVRVVWFNQLYLARMFKKGTKIALAGKVYDGKRGIYFANPAYEIIGTGQESSLHTRRLVPVYRETKGLTSRWIRMLVHRYLDTASSLREIFPHEVLLREKFLPPERAVRSIHFPETSKDAKEARRRFQFEELFLLQTRFIMEQKGRERIRAHAIPFDQSLIKTFVDKLPFNLTDGQRRAAWQILQDIAHPYPMQRLLEGDVGSGKTIVAFLAVLEVIKAGHQAIIMAPTEVLARQHFASAKKILGPHGITIGFVTSSPYALIASHASEKKIAKKTFRALLKEGGVHVAIGTHALLSPEMLCKDVALAIVDEQHRFGVDQRSNILKKSGDAQAPHFLSMSATPIPRTLALAVYGDLDISRITEMPSDRKPIETRLVAPAHRNEAYAFIRSEIKEGRQAFVICPRIELSNNADQRGMGPAQISAEKDRRKLVWNDVKAVKEEYEKLSKIVFPDLSVAMLHGKLKSKEKESVMKKFTEGQTDILVSTSVIEVGIDVPNATVMAIEGADRFGLATLHQFRGRVGRGEHKSYCLLFSDSSGAETQSRLRALVGAKNGFELAQIDLELRGPGEFMGEAQSGMPDIAMEALQDPVLIERVREDARKVCAEDPDLARHPAIRERLKRSGGRVHGE
ncbi:MAG: ATP-dependent DNA helicase RecG [bacterium]|nr:ATP-dependent DNA helicase RecG [bacterium]